MEKKIKSNNMYKYYDFRKRDPLYLRLLKSWRFWLLVVVLILIISGIVLFIKDLKNPSSKKSIFQKTYETDQYYIPVANYWSINSNISFDDLKNYQNLIIEKGEAENLSRLFGNDFKNKKQKSIKEINAGLSEAEIAIIKWQDVNVSLKTLSIDEKYLWNKDDFKDYKLKTKIKSQDRKILDQQFDTEKLIKLTAIGDVILGRTVAYKMKELGVLSPWLKVADRIKNADITFADLETPLSDKVEIPYEGMSFVGPTSAIAGLEKSGIDIVALANNHSTNFGAEVFSDTLDLLKNHKIKYVGGGKNIEEAEKTLYYKQNGLTFAFLDYNSIIGAVDATENSAGVISFKIKPWSQTDSEQDIVKIENAIKTARKKADIVITEFHWGVEYTTNPIDSQKNVAHRAINAGSDLVIGTHPHAVQGSEIYKGKYITYSLGNFIFDQEWSIGTKQGTVLENYFYGKKQVAANLAPIQIEDYHQPYFLSSDQAKEVLDRIKNASIGI